MMRPEKNLRIVKCIVIASAAVVSLVVLAIPFLRGDIDTSNCSHHRESAAGSLRSNALVNDRLSTDTNVAGNRHFLGTETKPSNETPEYYVFLQKFSLQSTFNLIYHTEIVVCPRLSFDADFKNHIDQLATSLSDFAPIEEKLWKDQASELCVQLGYGGAACANKCCSVGENVKYALNSRQAVISNADGSTKSLYLYGVSELLEGGEGAYQAVCSMNEDGNVPMCFSNWSGTDYNLFSNNCNTFTSTVLKCVFGMSDKKPNLGVSDMVTVTCPAENGGNQCVVPQKKALVEIAEEDVSTQ